MNRQYLYLIIRIAKNEEGQHAIYLVLSEEERSKGFIRPYRDKYLHVGNTPKYKRLHRMLDPNDSGDKEMMDKGYVAVMCTLENEDGSFGGGPYVDQKEFDAWNLGLLLGGCGVETRMSRAGAGLFDNRRI
jgi:hypothetical protein